MANMYENAAVARCSGDIRPTIRTEAVCREFWRVYARITGILIFSRRRNSAIIEFMDSSSGSGIEQIGNRGIRAEVSDGCLWNVSLGRGTGLNCEGGAGEKELGVSIVVGIDGDGK